MLQRVRVCPAQSRPESDEREEDPISRPGTGQTDSRVASIPGRRAVRPSVGDEYTDTGEQNEDGAKNTVPREALRAGAHSYSANCSVDPRAPVIQASVAATTSENFGLRFFYFALACLLSSIWRAVDPLVQVELTDEYERSPMATANTLTLLR